eukprot:6205820-Pleurochrysis_carterae.AAC.2
MHGAASQHTATALRLGCTRGATEPHAPLCRRQSNDAPRREAGARHGAAAATLVEAASTRGASVLSTRGGTCSGAATILCSRLALERESQAKEPSSILLYLLEHILHWAGTCTHQAVHPKHRPEKAHPIPMLFELQLCWAHAAIAFFVGAPVLCLLLPLHWAMRQNWPKLRQAVFFPLAGTTRIDHAAQRMRLLRALRATEVTLTTADERTVHGIWAEPYGSLNSSGQSACRMDANNGVSGASFGGGGAGGVGSCAGGGGGGDEGPPVVILLHANAMVLDDMSDWAQFYLSRGFSVLAITFAGCSCHRGVKGRTRVVQVVRLLDTERCWHCLDGPESVCALRHLLLCSMRRVHALPQCRCATPKEMLRSLCRVLSSFSFLRSYPKAALGVQAI